MSSVECVKHTVSDCLSCCYDLAYERGRANERAAIVAFLKTDPGGAFSKWWEAARAVKRGEHITKNGST